MSYKLILSNRTICKAVENLIVDKDGYITINNNLRFAPTAYTEIVEVDNIPDDFEDMKYNYTEEKVFEISKYWIDNSEKKDYSDRITQLQVENETLLLAVTEMTEYIATQDARLTVQENAITELSTIIAGGM